VDGRSTPLARALCDRLRQVTDAFLVDLNAHRPAYLDGLMGPTLVSGKGAD
jgi:hypothetical protein